MRLRILALDPATNWRRWMGIEPTSRVRRLTGFEDQGSHQTPFTSDAVNCSSICEAALRHSAPPANLTNGSPLPEPANVAGADGYARGVQVFHQRNDVFP